jgi:hypothetical protein
MPELRRGTHVSRGAIDAEPLGAESKPKHKPCSVQSTFDSYGHLFPSLEDDHATFAAGDLDYRSLSWERDR